MTPLVLGGCTGKAAVQGASALGGPRRPLCRTSGGSSSAQSVSAIPHHSPRRNKRYHTRRWAPARRALATTSAAAGLESRADEGEWFYSETGQKTWVDAMELDQLAPDMPELLQELGANYDAQRLADALAPRSMELNARAVHIAATLGAFLAKVARDYALGKLDENMEMRAEQLRSVLSGLGPSFVKIGQGLSSRPDLLPRVYLEKLSSLQDRLPSFPDAIAMRLIEEELGAPPEELFSYLSPEPVAAASLGQVYKGRLISGEEIAVKVQRPGIADSIAVDMLLLRRLVKLIDKNTPEITQPIVPLVDEFAKRLFGELDYMAEGRSCEKFTQLYGNVPRVRTPSIYWKYTSRRVLTMEWIDGVKLTDDDAMKAAGLEVVDFVDVGIECTLRQLLEYGYFHADPHPGNLLACPSGDLVYLDFGMMSEAPSDARYAIIAHVVHLVNRDYLAMCNDYYELGFMDRSVDTRPIAPALAEFFDDVLDSSVSKLNFKAIVDGLGDVLFKFPFKTPAYYALILRSLTVLEGLALQADPEYKLLAKAYPYMAKRLLTDPSPQLRSSFEGLVLRDGEFRWNRLDNLLRESSKSSDFDPEQMWVLAEWLVSPSARGVRDPLADEFVRIVDGLATGSIRDQLVRGQGGQEVADRLVPMGAREQASMRRGQALLERMSGLGRASGRSFSLRGSGPFGTMTPPEVQRLVSTVRSDLSQRAPQMQQLMRQPGAQEMFDKVTRGLLSRATARAFKLMYALGPVPDTADPSAGQRR